MAREDQGRQPSTCTEVDGYARRAHHREGEAAVQLIEDSRRPEEPEFLCMPEDRDQRVRPPWS